MQLNLSAAFGTPIIATMYFSHGHRPFIISTFLVSFLLALATYAFNPAASSSLGRNSFKALS
jgi:hypothetical protein